MISIFQHFLSPRRAPRKSFSILRHVPTVDELAEAIHDADDRASTAWPMPGEKQSYSTGAIRLANEWEMDTRRRQARAVAHLLGVELAEA